MLSGMVACSTGLRLLAIGSSCPPGLKEGIKDGTYNGFSIVRVLQATGSCFISQCIIKLATLEESLQAVVKSYTKDKLEAVEQQQVELEIRLHQQLTDKHAVPFWMAIEDTKQIHIISKYCSEGDLRQRLSAGRMSEAIVRDQIAVPLLQILQDMHSKGIVHRDLKPENIFMGPDTVLLGDFGLAVATAQLPTACNHAAGTQQPILPNTALSVDAMDDSSSNGSTTCLMDDNSSTNSTTCPLDGCSNASNSCLRSCNSAEPGFRHMPAPCSALKRTSVSSSDLSSMADCSMCEAVCSQDAAAASPGFRRSSSTGCVDVWGSGALPVTPNMTAGGTPAYSSPEIVFAAFSSESAATAVGPQNDIWALGVLAVECLTGQHPFGDHSMSPYAFMFNIIQKQLLSLQQLPVTEQCKEWLTMALQKDPCRRATAQQLLRHEWITLELGAPDTVAGVAVQQNQQMQSLQQHASTPCRQLDCCTSEDLTRLSGLTDAEYACTRLPPTRPDWSWSDHRAPDAPAGIHNDTRPYVAAASQAAKPVQVYGMQGNSELDLQQPWQPTACKLQQLCSHMEGLVDRCSSTPAVVQCRLHPEGTAPSLALLSSIGSWED